VAARVVLVEAVGPVSYDVEILVVVVVVVVVGEHRARREACVGDPAAGGLQAEAVGPAV